MAQHSDMSGMWSGLYRYVHHSGAIRFTVWIEDSNGNISGGTLEPNTFAAQSGEELEAHISGTREGLSFQFQKIYAASSGIIQPALLYTGDVNAEFSEAHGVWDFGSAGDLSGTFQLSRVSIGAIDKVERKAEVDA